MLRLIFTYLCLCIVHLSCVTTNEEDKIRDYDAHEVKAELLSFFNQREVPAGPSRNWKGDWLFRRERLAIIDKELGDIKPDLFISQDVMERIGNSFESDLGILSSGSLKGYKWSLSPIEHYQDTGEVESLGVAVIAPLTLKPPKEGNIFRVGLSVFALERVVIEGQSLAVVNLKVDDKINDEEFERLMKLLELRLKDKSICRQRILLAMYVPSEFHERLSELSDLLGLRDAARGFCNVENKCYTANPRNEIFYTVHGESPPARSDFLFVPKSTQVRVSNNNFTESHRPETTFYQKFGLTALWASDRSGWFAALRFARCEKELEPLGETANNLAIDYASSFDLDIFRK